MGKFFSFFGILFVAFSANAQLYVGANSYVYVNNQYVTVTDNINLGTATSNIYLRNNGQILQKTTSSGGANTGLGSLSVFQEGTTNNFQYNYWCSPVGGSLATSGNSPFGISQFGVPLTTTGTNPATILPTNNPDGASSNGALSIAARWIYKYSMGSGYNNWIYVNSATNINAGEGFTMKGTSGTDATIPHSGIPSNNSGSAQRYDFRGKPNDGTINVPVATGMRTLTGNPYPSAIDVQLFLNDPENVALCDGTALYWEHDKTANSHYLAQYRGGYGVYNAVTNVYTPATFYTYDGAGNQGSVASTPMNMYERKFAPIGQGFKVRGIANGNLKIKNTHRVYRSEGVVNNSQFERASNSNRTTADFYEKIPNVAGIDYTQISQLPTPHVKINASLNGRAVRQLALVFLNNSSSGYDRGDSKSPDKESNLPFDAYLILNNDEFIQSANTFDLSNRYPIGFKNNTNAVFKIQVAEIVNSPEVESVYLYDSQTGLYHDIKNTEYQVTLPPGVNNTRFEIVFRDQTLNVNGNSFSNLTVYQDNENSFLRIKNPSGINLTSLSMFDINGKVIFTKNNLGADTSFEFSTTGLSEGVYVISLNSSEPNQLVKKITVSSKK